MKVRHFAILLAWTVFVLSLTWVALMVFVYGAIHSREAVDAYFWVIVGLAVVLYLTVTFVLARKWNRDVL